jgi:hypothetical protein
MTEIVRINGAFINNGKLAANHEVGVSRCVLNGSARDGFVGVYRTDVYEVIGHDRILTDTVLIDAPSLDAYRDYQATGF